MRDVHVQIDIAAALPPPPRYAARRRRHVLVKGARRSLTRRQSATRRCRRLLSFIANTGYAMFASSLPPLPSPYHAARGAVHDSHEEVHG